MPFRLLLTFAIALLVALLAAVPAGAASVAYIDDHNLWLSSPDGSQKFQMTQGGTEDASWNFPSQGPVQQALFPFGVHRPASTIQVRGAARAMESII